MKNEELKTGPVGRTNGGRGRAKRRLFLPILISSFFILHFSFSPVRADDSHKHAERGVQAYQAGKYDLARMFFTRALQDAVLKGKDEWAAKATLNLVDIELESMDEAEAGRLLDNLNSRDPHMRCLTLWKRSQLAYLKRDHVRAIAQADSALRLAKDNALVTAVRLDRLRYLIASREPAEWAKEYDAVRSRLGSAERGRAASLEASVAMARKDFAKADTLWRRAIEYYRAQGRHAKVAACMNQSAVTLFSLGHREDALDRNARAVASYAELGLAMPGLRAQALRLLLVNDDRELARLRREMDLLGLRHGGFDLQGILDEYAQALRGSPATRPGP